MFDPSAMLLAALTADRPAMVTDLRPRQDWQQVLENPGKGLYHHLLDNGTDRYPATPAQIAAIPGCRQLYVRLSWAHFQPEPGRFDWHWIDDLVRDWVPRGYRLSLRLTCKETSEVYAVPRWVVDAGAQGARFRRADWSVDAWEPVWDDPVFLRHLEAFLLEVGRRYDGAPWLEFVDIGTIGDWGEGHTSFGSRLRVPSAVRWRHVELHRAAFRRTPLVVIDDFCAEVEADDGGPDAFWRRCRDAGLWLRDDSVGVDWWLNTGAKATWSLAKPAWFAEAATTTPTVIELEHYVNMRDQGNWRGSDACERGRDWLMPALDLAKPTWLGYHGDAAIWLAENPALTRELANRVGYWLAPERIEVDQLDTGSGLRLSVALANRGWARPYRAWSAVVRLSREGQQIDLPVDGLDGRGCVAEATTTLHGRTIPSAGLPAGTWSVGLRWCDGDRPIRFALDGSAQDDEGWVAAGSLVIDR